MKRALVVIFVLLALVGGYFGAAHLSGGAYPTPGLEVGGDRGELRRETAVLKSRVDSLEQIVSDAGDEHVNPELASDILVNPPDDFTADCSTQPNPPGSDEDVQEVTEAFQAVVTQ